ncbi:unnamed protein product [Cochlearia groenlandica]
MMMEEDEAAKSYFNAVKTFTKPFFVATPPCSANGHESLPSFTPTRASSIHQARYHPLLESFIFHPHVPPHPSAAPFLTCNPHPHPPTLLIHRRSCLALSGGEIRLVGSYHLVSEPPLYQKAESFFPFCLFKVSQSRTCLFEPVVVWHRVVASINKLCVDLCVLDVCQLAAVVIGLDL